MLRNIENGYSGRFASLLEARDDALAELEGHALERYGSRFFREARRHFPGCSTDGTVIGDALLRSWALFNWEDGNRRIVAEGHGGMLPPSETVAASWMRKARARTHAPEFRLVRAAADAMFRFLRVVKSDEEECLLEDMLAGGDMLRMPTAEMPGMPAPGDMIFCQAVTVGDLTVATHEPLPAGRCVAGAEDRARFEGIMRMMASEWRRLGEEDAGIRRRMFENLLFMHARACLEDRA